jgi:uncharacterized protein (TIGR02646 family)
MSFPFFEKIDFVEEYIPSHKILILTVSDKNSWSDKKFQYVKKKIRFHYSVVQDDKCAYCRRQLNFGGYSEPIEHIVPRADNYLWMFEQKNLVLSCNACNSCKSGKSTLKPAMLTSATYPANKTDYIIYHPHFDIYSNELEFEDNMFYKWKTNKGKKTIEVCGLNNMAHLFYNAAVNNMNNDYDSVLDKIMYPNKYGLEKKDVDEFRKALVRRVKHLKKLNKAK